LCDKSSVNYRRAFAVRAKLILTGLFLRCAISGTCGCLRLRCVSMAAHRPRDDCTVPPFLREMIQLGYPQLAPATRAATATSVTIPIPAAIFTSAIEQNGAGTAARAHSKICTRQSSRKRKLESGAGDEDLQSKHKTTSASSPVRRARSIIQLSVFTHLQF